jgi:hypothetical protein
MRNRRYRDSAPDKLARTYHKADTSRQYGERHTQMRNASPGWRLLRTLSQRHLILDSLKSSSAVNYLVTI